ITSDVVREACIRFLQFRSIGIFFILVSAALRAFYVGIATPKVLGIYSAIMAAVNILLGYMLIFGNLGAPKMGIAGAGFASSIAEGIGLLFLLGYTVIRHDIKEYKLFRFRSFQKDLVGKTLTLSAPLVVQNLISMGAWFIFFVFVEKMGQHA